MKTLNAIFFLIGMCALPLACHAQHFPAAGKSIRIVVPFPPGGATDIQARLIAQKLVESLHVPVLVENKPGASTVIGSREVASAVPDGHTLLCTIGIIAQLPHLFRAPPFELFRDFTPLTAISLAGTVLTAHVSLPASNVAELIAYAKSHPGKVIYASFGSGTSSHLNGEALKRLAGIDIVHAAYRGSSEFSRDLLAGKVHISFDGPTTALLNAKSGKVKLLGAATDRRIAVLPDLPTLREQGLAVGSNGFIGFFGPGAMPPALAEVVTHELAKVISLPETRKALVEGGTEQGGMSRVEFAAIVRSVYEYWGGVIRETGVRLD